MRRTNLLNRIPILTPRLGFTGLKETEIGLVVGIDPGHDLDVGAELSARVRVGEVAVPRVAELVIAPGPLLLAGRNVVISNVHEARLGRVIIAAEEVLLRAHAHVGGGHRDIGVE